MKSVDLLFEKILYLDPGYGLALFAMLIVLIVVLKAFAVIDKQSKK